MEVKNMKTIVSVGLLALLIPLGVIQSRRGVSENRVDGQMDSEAQVDRRAAAARRNLAKFNARKGRTVYALSADGELVSGSEHAQHKDQKVHDVVDSSGEVLDVPEEIDSFKAELDKDESENESTSFGGIVESVVEQILGQTPEQILSDTDKAGVEQTSSDTDKAGESTSLGELMAAVASGATGALPESVVQQDKKEESENESTSFGEAGVEQTSSDTDKAGESTSLGESLVKGILSLVQQDKQEESEKESTSFGEAGVEQTSSDTDKAGESTSLGESVVQQDKQEESEKESTSFGEAGVEQTKPEASENAEVESDKDLAKEADAASENAEVESDRNLAKEADVATNGTDDLRPADLEADLNQVHEPLSLMQSHQDVQLHKQQLKAFADHEGAVTTHYGTGPGASVSPNNASLLKRGSLKPHMTAAISAEAGASTASAEAGSSVEGDAI